MLTDITTRLAAKSGKTMLQIADEMQVADKTLKRLLSDKVGSPSLNTLVQFLRVCGAEIDDIVDIFAESQIFLVRKPAAEIDQQNTELRNELTRARAEIDELLARVADLTAERDTLREESKTLREENKTLREKNETLREKNDKLCDELLDLYRAGKV